MCVCVCVCFVFGGVNFHVFSEVEWSGACLIKLVEDESEKEWKPLTNSS